MTTFTSILSGPALRLPRVSFPLVRWLRVSSERRSLAGLDARQLRDIGIDAATAAAEASRPFWDVPEGR